MAEIEVVCPSGLRGVVRGLKMREFKLFADRRGMKTGRVWDEVTESCWVETTDEGPYGKRPQWNGAVLQGDRLVALLAIRRATHGDVFDFVVPCPDRGCRAQIRWSVNLNPDAPEEERAIRVKPYPTASLERHMRGEPFTTTLAGRAVTFGLLTVNDEKQMAKFVEGKPETDRLIATIAYRCKKVEGIADKDAVIEWLEELELADVLAFRDAMDDATGGVETTFDVECPECGLVSEVELPFGGKDFWTPTSRTTGRAVPSSYSDATTSTRGGSSSTRSATSDTGEADTE